MSDEPIQDLTPDEISGKAYTPSLPVCSHCGSDPALISGVITRIGGNFAAVFFCSNPQCRKIHSVAPIPNPELPQQKPHGLSGLWTPNGR